MRQEVFYQQRATLPPIRPSHATDQSVIVAACIEDQATIDLIGRGILPSHVLELAPIGFRGDRPPRMQPPGRVWMKQRRCFKLRQRMGPAQTGPEHFVDGREGNRFAAGPE
jgi:hypothetical protein